MQTLKTWTGRIALVAGSVLVTLVLLEAGVRLYETASGRVIGGPKGGETTTAIQRFHEIIGYEQVPDTTVVMKFAEHPRVRVELKTNNLGLRSDRDTIVEKPPGTYRILVLGDSQTAGFVYNDETWPVVLEGMLNERHSRSDGRRYEILNAGVNGYSPLREYLWWRVHGRDLHPDMVIIAYYTGNDLYDAGRGRLLRQPDGSWTLDETPQPEPVDDTPRSPLERSRLYQIAIQPLLTGSQPASSGRTTLIDTPDFRDRFGRLYLTARRICQGCFTQSLLQSHLLLVGYPDEYEADIRTTSEIFRRMRDETREVGSGFVVVMIPNRLQIEGDVTGLAAKVAQALNMQLPDPPFEDRLQDELLAVCARDGIPHVDPRGALKTMDAAIEEPLYYTEDWHLNVKGNGVFADCLAGDRSFLSALDPGE